MDESDDKERAAPVLTCEQAKAILQNDPDLQQKRNTFEGLRRLLSKKKNAAEIDEMLCSGLIHILVQGMSTQDEKIKLECAWTLAIAFSSVEDQALNVLQAGALKPLLQLVLEANDRLPTRLCRAIALALSSVSSCSVPTTNLEPQILPQALTLLMQHQDHATHLEACIAVALLTNGDADEQKLLMRDAGVLPLVVRFLCDDDEDLVGTALQVLSNMAYRNDSFSREVIEIGAVRVLPDILRKWTSNYVIEEVMLLVKDILENASDQTQILINGGLLNLIISVLHTGNYACQFLSAEALALFVKNAPKAQVLELRKANLMPALAAGFRLSRPEVFNHCLEIVDGLLSAVEMA